MSLDQQTMVAELRERARQFVTQQESDCGNSPKNLGVSITIKAAELLKLFQTVSAEQSAELMDDPITRAKAVPELADLIIYCLCFADLMGIDICTAVECRTEYIHRIATEGH